MMKVKINSVITNMNYNEMEKLLKITENFNTSKGSTKKELKVI